MTTKDIGEYSRLQDLCDCNPQRTGDTYSTCETEHEEGCRYIAAIANIRSEATREEGFTRG